MHYTKKLIRNSTTSTAISSLICMVLVATQVSAADIASNDVSSLTNSEFGSRWEGSYLGVNLGITGAGTNIDRGAGNKDVTFVEGQESIGVSAGFNRQLGAGNWLWGGEIGLSTLRSKFTKDDPIVGKVHLQSNAVGEAMLRAGYDWERLHLYGTAGLAISDIQTFGAFKEKNSLRVGLAYGVGAEFALNQNWSTKFEAIQYNFGETDVELNGAKRNVELGAGAFRIGIARKF